MRTELENALLERINSGTCEGFGDVETYGYVSLVEDYDDDDFVVIEDHLGFMTVSRFTHIDIDAGGYYQPARKYFNTLRDEYDAWLCPDDDQVAQDWAHWHDSQ